MTKFPLEVCEVLTVQTHRQGANLQEINKTLLLERLNSRRVQAAFKQMLEGR